MLEEESSEFFEWLRSKGLSEGTLRDYRTAAQRLGIEECECDFACIRRKILKVRTKPEKRVIQNYITFCTDYADELEARKAKKLRRLLNQVKKEERRKLGVETVELSLEDLERRLSSSKIKCARPYFIFQFFSGVRLSEVYRVKEMLEKGERYIKIDDENAYLPLSWIRGNKVATVAFAPISVFELLSAAEPCSYGTTKRLGLALKIRENWFQKCVSITGYPELCKWMQGRTGDLGVSEHHYLDLMGKAKQYYPLIAKGLRGEAIERVSWLKMLDIHFIHLQLLRDLGLR